MFTVVPKNNSNRLLLWQFLFLNFYFVILGSYFKKPKNELCTSTEIIDTLEECKVAINSLDQTFGDTLTLPNYPKGCQIYDGGTFSYWNTHASGSKQIYARPICKTGESI